MFHTSSQRKHWIFESIDKINSNRAASNNNFIEMHRKLKPNAKIEYLNPNEEKLLLTYYTQFVFNICRRFKPPVPLSLIGTSLSYFKRFYLYTSVMEFHPKDIAYLCVYLACKIDEYNVSIDQFMEQAVVKRSLNMQKFLIDNELVLLQKLNYHLTVHSPYRPLEGFLIDVKTKKSIPDIEKHRTNIEQFLTSSLLTDVILLFTPSQLALAAIENGVGREQLIGYLQLTLDTDSIEKVLCKLKRIQEIVCSIKVADQTEIFAIEDKLKLCKDYENDPFSDLYHQREISRQEAKEMQKRKKFQELYDIKHAEEKMLAESLD
ncbi:cyclin-H [Hydra vulgaris]|uniref:Cyclin-H n=1 Tax=Hydra vulgaris TaxID=6087 RepID=T2MFT7_HYDVU|nr:cyclin-H [Hydra vulgaris]QOY46803.1 cyclin H [Hydra vulgaris]